jgi:hypothetical protein
MMQFKGPAYTFLNSVSESVTMQAGSRKRSGVLLWNPLFTKVGDGSTELNRRAFGSHSAFGVTLLDGSESSPVPRELLADTAKV